MNNKPNISDKFFTSLKYVFEHLDDVRIDHKRKQIGIITSDSHMLVFDWSSFDFRMMELKKAATHYDELAALQKTFTASQLEDQSK